MTIDRTKVMAICVVMILALTSVFVLLSALYPPPPQTVAEKLILEPHDMAEPWEWKVYSYEPVFYPNEAYGCFHHMVNYKTLVYLYLDVHVFNTTKDSHAAFLSVRSSLSGLSGEKPQNVTIGDEAIYWPQETTHDYTPSFIFVRSNVMVWVETDMNQPSHHSSAYDTTLAIAQTQLEKIDANLPA